MNDAERAEVQAMIDRWAQRLRRRAVRKGVALEDLKSSAWVAALKARKNYDPALARLSTHLYTPCNYAMLRELLAMGSPVTQPRDAYHLEPLHQSSEWQEHHSSSSNEAVIQASQLVRKIETIAGPLTNLVLELILGQKTLLEAAGETDVSELEMRLFRDYVLQEVRK